MRVLTIKIHLLFTKAGMHEGNIQVLRNGIRSSLNLKIYFMVCWSLIRNWVDSLDLLEHCSKIGQCTAVKILYVHTVQFSSYRGRRNEKWKYFFGHFPSQQICDKTLKVNKILMKKCHKNLSSGIDFNV